MTKSRKETILRVVKEQNLAKALAGLEDGTYLHVRQVSKATGTPRTTLICYMNGGQTKREANHHRQQLSPDEEAVFAK